jgi:hypothetical protein
MDNRAVVWSAAVPVVLTATLGVALVAGDLNLDTLVQLLQAFGDFLDQVTGILESGGGGSGGGSDGMSDMAG